MKPMRTYTIVVEPEEGGGYFVTVPALPDSFTGGQTVEEYKKRAVEVIEVRRGDRLSRPAKRPSNCR